MTVTAVTSQSTDTVSASSGSSVADLEQQLANLQQQVTKENKSSDDSQTKQKILQALEMEIAMIEAEIQEAKASAAKGGKNQGGSASGNGADISDPNSNANIQTYYNSFNALA